MTTKGEKLTSNIDKLLSLLPGGANDVDNKQQKIEFLTNSVVPVDKDLLAIYDPDSKSYFACTIVSLRGVLCADYANDIGILGSVEVYYPLNNSFRYDTDGDGLADYWQLTKSTDITKVVTNISEPRSMIRGQSILTKLATQNADSYVRLFQKFSRNFSGASFNLVAHLQVLGTNPTDIHVEVNWSVGKDGVDNLLTSASFTPEQLATDPQITVHCHNLPDNATYIQVVFYLKGMSNANDTQGFILKSPLITPPVTTVTPVSATGINIYDDTQSFTGISNLTFEGFQVSEDVAKQVKIVAPKFEVTDGINIPLGMRVPIISFPTSNVAYEDPSDQSSRIAIIPQITFTANQVTVTSNKFILESGITLSQGDGDNTGYGVLNVDGGSFKWSMGDSPNLDNSGTANTLIVAEGLVAEPGKDANTMKILLAGNIYEQANLSQWLSVAQNKLLISARVNATDAESLVWFGNSMFPLPDNVVGDIDSKTIYLTPEPGKSLEQFLVIFKVSFEGYAPQDGFVRVFIKDSEAGEGSHSHVYLKDINGSPLAVQRNYRKNNTLGEILLVGVVEMESTTGLQFHMIHSFDEWIRLDNYVDNPSAILIQSVDINAQALYEFERITGLDVQMYIHRYTNPIARLSHLFGNTLPQKTYASINDQPSGNYFSENGFYLMPLNETIDMTLEDRVMYFSGTPLAKGIPFFYMLYLFGENETLTLRNKLIKGSVETGTCNQSATFMIASWDGTGKTIDADNVIKIAEGTKVTYGDNWTKLMGKSIAPLFSGQQTTEVEATIPANARMCAVVYVYNIQQTPVNCNLLDMTVSVDPAFTGVTLKYIHPRDEQFFSVKTDYDRFLQSNLRYTINNTESACPLGVRLGLKSLPVEIDPTVNQIPGSVASGGEGAFIFNQDVNQVKINTSVRIFPGEKLPSGDSQVTFTWYSVGLKGELTPYPNGKFSTSVWKNGSPVAYNFSITGDFVSGDRLALRMKSQGADYAYLLSTSSHLPLIENVISGEVLVQKT